MSKVKELLKKHGVLYAMLPDLNKKDGKSEILFHSEAAPRIKAIIELLNAGKMETIYRLSSNTYYNCLRQGLWIFMIKPFNNDEIVDEFKQAKKF